MGIILLVIVCFIFSTPLIASPYNNGEWISYTDLRYINSIAVGPKYIYFGTTGGVSRYDRYRERWTCPLTTSNGLPDNRVRRLAYDPTSGYLWVDTFSGVCRWHPLFENCLVGGQFPGGLALKREGSRLLPDLFTDPNYVFYSEGYVEDRTFRRYYIRDIAEDGWGNLWIGTWGLNAGRADLTTFRLKMLQVGLVEEDVGAILFDGDEIWFGGTGGVGGAEGITRFNRRSGEWSYFQAGLIEGLPSDEVNCLAADSHYVWVGTQYGLGRYDKDKEKWKSFTTFEGLSYNAVTDVLVVGDTLWVGTAAGLDLLDPKTGVLEADMPKELRTISITDLGVGGDWVWVATEEGVYRYNRIEEKWKEFTAPPGYLEPEVIIIDPESGRVWFAVSGHPQGAGISLRLRLGKGRPSPTLLIPWHVSLYDESTGKWRRYVPPSIVAGGSLLCLAFHGGMLWAGTTDGVLRLDPGKGTWQRFSTADGLIDDRVQVIRGNGNDIWFGTPKGVSRFHWVHPLEGG